MLIASPSVTIIALLLRAFIGRKYLDEIFGISYSDESAAAAGTLDCSNHLMHIRTLLSLWQFGCASGLRLKMRYMNDIKNRKIGDVRWRRAITLDDAHCASADEFPRKE
jgi:hypothetical protein